MKLKIMAKKCVMEVAQHIGNHTVRCIMLAPVKVFTEIWKLLLPAAVSKFLLEKKHLAVFSMSQVKLLMAAKIKREEKWSIHREPPAFEEQNPVVRFLKQVSKLSTFLHLMQKVVRLVCSVVPV